MRTVVLAGLLSFLVLGLPHTVRASERTTVHHGSHLPQDQSPDKDEAFYDARNHISHNASLPEGPPCGNLSAEVHGFHPYWYGSAYEEYDYSLLSTVSYFAYHIDPATGDPKAPFLWPETALANRAADAGIRLELTLTLFGERDTKAFLRSKQAQAHCIGQVLAALKKRGGVDLCLDFEGLHAEERDAFEGFVRQLSTRLRAAIPDARLTMTLPAVDWRNVFRIKPLLPMVDRFILMAYDYHTDGSKQAGPIAPLRSSTKWSSLSVERSVAAYLKKGVPADALLLSVAYYGRSWPTQGVAVPSRALGRGVTLPYRHIVPLVANATRSSFDGPSQSPLLERTVKGATRQLWYENAESLAAKYAFAKEQGLAGVAIFALGYDNNRTELWGALRAAFCPQ